MSYSDSLDADDEAFGDTIQDTLNLSDSAQLREDAKFHEMSRYVEIVVRDTGLLKQPFLERHATLLDGKSLVLRDGISNDCEVDG